MSQSRGGSRPIPGIVLLVAVVLALPLLAMVAMMPVMMMGTGGAMPMSPGVGLGMVLVVGLVVVVVVVLLYRALTSHLGTRHEPAIEELRLAYASGELTHEEFEQRREALRQSE